MPVKKPLLNFKPKLIWSENHLTIDPLRLPIRFNLSARPSIDQFTKGLTPEEIQAIADYYASLMPSK